jgi:hypothetical protein
MPKKIITKKNKFKKKTALKKRQKTNETFQNAGKNKKAQFMAGLDHYSYIHPCNPCCKIFFHTAPALARQLFCRNSCTLIPEQHSSKPWF